MSGEQGLGQKGELTPKIEALRAFAMAELPGHFYIDDELTFSPVTGDAGFREYFRLNTRMPVLAVWAPPETEDSLQFCEVAHFLRDHGVRAPNVLAVDFEKGLLLVEDFGDVLLQSELSVDTVDGYYSEAMSMLMRMQVAPHKDSSLFPSYSPRLLRQELELFDEWYVSKLLGLSLHEDERALLDSTYGLLIDRARAQEQVVVHRDFHSRNLLVLGNGALATIDFQDAVIGPYTYDLVSLLKDCYVRWEKDRVQRWALSYASLAIDAGVCVEKREGEFLKDFDWMGLQRHIKVLGIFARLYLRDGKAKYLQDLPRVLAYVLDACADYEEMHAFSHFIQSRLQPQLDKLKLSGI